LVEGSRGHFSNLTTTFPTPVNDAGTDGKWELDKQYSASVITSTLDAQISRISGAWVDERFKTYMMWTPPGGDSIPVPISGD